MVVAAEEDEVVEVGFAAVGPVVDVVVMEKAAVGAAGEAASALVADEQRPMEGRGDGPALAAQVQARASGTGLDRDQVGVAAEAAERFCGLSDPLKTFRTNWEPNQRFHHVIARSRGPGPTP